MPIGFPLAVVLIALAALALGGLLGWLLAAARGRGTAERLAATAGALEAERDRRAALENELTAVREARERAERDLAAAKQRAELAEAFVEKARVQLRDSFEALAADALRGNRDEFLKLTDRDQEERRRGIEALLAPLQQTLEKLEKRTSDIEKAREGAYGDLRAQLRELASATSSLQERTISLTTALKGSRAQGRWGEIALENIVELAGMQEHVDFERQKETAGGKRPDLVVHLPGGRFVAVDAKVPFNAYMEAVEATTPEARTVALDRHVAALRRHISTLASREYASTVEGDVDLVVLFLPGDPFLGAAFERAPDLQVEALRSKVLLATPTTLLALLRTVAIYWQQKSLAENAERIADVARELYERTGVFGEHLTRMGRGLESAVDAFNRAAGSFERRLLPLGRRLEEMKVAEHASRDLEAPQPLERAPRGIGPSAGGAGGEEAEPPEGAADRAGRAH